ncbi:MULTISPECIES: 3-hydroxyacyl-CoA dehydrogenase [Streptomyces]|uniref:3-hydroxyacyl-CoA dehydrogenase n=2 Tax=Streptomyces griseoaurantiacus TaxID=68213 RepID=F3NCZ5_9ACTN|nr:MULTISPECIES: 3-hydroxyacyl-CoA dehydrogenase [Streptomyces]GHE55536.1 3-hydroxyacyl-CoA dehydrogenase [Streptomyces griseoaurantiacus]EGG48676.1 3-hydroxyacyl-CoA dehydrogenase [Streptomyces griseoaurantiacus M045]MDX3090779.1 3-hydroxyacyl-CoA dehydrogenase [Streptomyces sp. ME12-02E]MDX3334244.1 3-hydroxyacyl-CoA dehydrogenase [Streptomyces sp. ME02-6978a]MDX3362070.1 3-hydroxyacyl-CoA dehydrogenase [Streptomyces sp. ME02-6978.2a]
MTGLDLSSPVAVVGTGTMGQGIAQVALVAGHVVRLYDAVPGRAEEAAAALADRLDRLVAKERMSAADREAALARLRPAADLADLADCSLVVEAVVERLQTKQELFRALEEVVDEDCLLATNTSSLSVTAVGGALRTPGRLVGLHFFNPAPLLPLVEVVSGFATDVTSATRAYGIARAWGKTPVACADTPGFIVNRIARPFYAEAFAVLESQAADPATIDAVLRECGGFRMGAFELTDLIGQDVNESVTHSVWRSFFQDVRFAPSLAQRRLVESGRLGRKSGRGWYDYAEGAERPEPHTAEKAEPPAYVVVEGDLGPAAELLALIREAGIQVREEDEDHGTRLVLPGGGQLALADGQTSVEFRDVVYFDLAPDYRRATRIALSASQDTAPDTLTGATGLFQALGKDVSVIGDAPGMIVARTVARIIDLAHDAVAKGVATEEDVDTAMRLGVNYPLGPFEWSRRLGRNWAYALLDDLHLRDPSGRYAPSLALYRHAYASEKREGTS